MSFLSFYGEDVPRRDPPRRIYGRVDAREPPDGTRDGERTILIDSIDADWFDEVFRNVAWLGAPEILDEVDRRISVVEAHAGGPAGGPDERRTGEGAWLELSFTEGDDVAHYMNLFAAPLSRGIMGWYTIEQPDVQERLVHATGLGHLQDASQTDIGTALARITAPDAVAIYDVGHGNCTALIERGRPSLYFDFGGGVLGNRSTFPAALQHFCVGADPLIVLSHWDYDHWSSGKRDPRALYCQWLVPRQRLGPVHTVFLGELHAHGNVLVWPTGLASASSGAATVEACTGSRKSRNDSGLALLVDHPDGSRMLLPGDCGYDHVPSAGGSFASVVVPHHGGRTASSVIPARDGRQSGRCVYSAGAGNSYGHPFPDVERAHAQVWNHELRTEHRGHSGLGHVHLYWDAHAAAADPACCGTYCELTCQQR